MQSHSTAWTRVVHLCRSVRSYSAICGGVDVARRASRRPRDGTVGKKYRRRVAVPCGASGRRDLSAAELRLHGRRNRIFRHRRGALVDRRRTVAARSGRRNRAPQRGLSAENDDACGHPERGRVRGSRRTHRGARGRRRRGDPLHVGHDRSFEGRDDQPSQSCVERDNAGRHLGLHCGDVLVHALPIYHVHGLFVALHCALFSGATTRFLPRFEIGAVTECARRAQAAFMGVPNVLHASAGLARFPAIRHIAATVDIGLRAAAARNVCRVRTANGAAILERYGMTEAGMITSNPLQVRASPEPLVGHCPAYPRACRREDGTLARERAAGRTRNFRAKRVRRLLAQRRENARLVYRDGYFITGDVVTMDATGVVSIVGRQNDLIISGGLNVYPKEIEEQIDALSGVANRPSSACRIRISAKASSPWSTGLPMRSKKPTSSGRCANVLPVSKCPNAWCSSIPCRATRWARCRRSCSEKHTARCSRGNG